MWVRRSFLALADSRSRPKMAERVWLGERGIGWLDSLGRENFRVRVRTITEPRGIDFAMSCVLRLPLRIVELERRGIDAFL